MIYQCSQPRFKSAGASRCSRGTVLNATMSNTDGQLLIVICLRRWRLQLEAARTRYRELCSQYSCVVSLKTVRKPCCAGTAPQVRQHMRAQALQLSTLLCKQVQAVINRKPAEATREHERSAKGTPGVATSEPLQCPDVSLGLHAQSDCFTVGAGRQYIRLREHSRRQQHSSSASSDAQLSPTESYGLSPSVGLQDAEDSIYISTLSSSAPPLLRAGRLRTLLV